MSKQYPGGLITKTPITPTSLSAPGVWNLNDQARAQANNTWPFPRDPQFNYVTMLLHGDGSAGVPSTGSGAGASSTVTAFNTDASTNNFNVTINGDARSDRFTPYQGTGYYSNYFGSANYISAASNAAFGFGTGDFTVEAWVYPNAAYTTYNYIWATGVTNGLVFYVLGGVLYVRTYGNSDLLASSVAPVLNTWTHVATTRSGTTLRIFVNGVLTGTTTNSTNFATGSGLVGNDGSNAAPWLGYISNMRVVKGTALYTSGFTPSTTPLTAVSGTSILTCQSNRFIDNSTNAFAITTSGSPQVSPAIPFTLPSSVATYGSGYFSGTTGGFLNAPANTAFNLGTGDFTVGGWVYPTSTSGTRPIVEIRTTGGANGFALLSQSGATTLNVYTNSGFVGASSNSLTTNAWNYVALTRSGNTWTYWINGVSGGTFSNTSTQSDGATTGPKVGGSTTSGEIWVGYLTDIFVVKGTALYSTTFTPPTSQLTAVSGTSLLTTQFNGGGNNSGFKDSSQFNFPITRNGNTTQGTFTPYGSNWSSYVNGSSYFNVGSVEFLAPSTWTVEMWINTTTSANYVTLASQYVASGGGFSVRTVLGINSSTGTVSIFQGGSIQNGTTNVTNGQWNHVAFVLSGGTVKAYVNGVNEATFTGFSTPTGITTKFYYDGYNSTSYYTGYASNLRVTNTAVYTTTFTPSTTPLTAITGTQLLTLQSNRYVDNSTNAYTVTVNGSPSVQRFSPFAPLTVYNPTTYGGSGYFDGSGDYLTAPSTSGQLGSGNFTIECWSYLKSKLTLYPTLWGNYTSFGAGSLGIFAGHDAADTTKYNIAINGTFPAIQSTASIIYNQWTHIALVRSGTTVTLYVNGVANGTATSSATLNGTSGTTYIGTAGDSIADGYLNGYLTDSRVLVGTALYTTAFTPPTAPLTAITNTKLLLNYTNAGILDNAMMNDLETVGNAQISTSVKKYGIGSMAFDGSGDWLASTAITDLYAFGTGAFTIEFWLYLNTTTGTQIVYDCRPSGTNGTQPIIFIDAGVVKFQHSTVVRITGATLSTGTWYHIALARSGTDTKLFVNGTQSGSTYTSDSTSYSCGAGRPIIGTDAAGVGSNNLNAYLDDLRVTKGVARYTATFTPPTEALPNG